MLAERVTAMSPRPDRSHASSARTARLQRASASDRGQLAVEISVFARRLRLRFEMAQRLVKPCHLTHASGELFMCTGLNLRVPREQRQPERLLQNRYGRFRRTGTSFKSSGSQQGGRFVLCLLHLAEYRTRSIEQHARFLFSGASGKDGSKGTPCERLCFLVSGGMRELDGPPQDPLTLRGGDGMDLRRPEIDQRERPNDLISECLRQLRGLAQCLHLILALPARDGKPRVSAQEVDPVLAGQ